MTYVRVMAEYCADPVWDIDGMMMSLEELPVEEALRADLRNWCDWYDRDCKDFLPDPPPFPHAEFAGQGLALAKRVKAMLPDWTVIYWDENGWRSAYLENDTDNRARYEYEVTG